MATSKEDQTRIQARKRPPAGHLSQNKAKNLLLPGAVILLTVLGWYFVLQQNQSLVQTTISTYQQTELEIVRSVARSIQNYVTLQTASLGQTDIPEIEQEVFTLFVKPIRLLENGGAWICTPDYIIFDQSSDLPQEYRNKNIAEIFASEAEQGASHYESMVEAVMAGREGVGWYIWLPEKGQEITAWTPVTAGEHTWVIGLSTPLPEILEANGVASQIRFSMIIMSLGTLAAMGLLAVWVLGTIQQEQASKALADSNILYQSLVETLPRRIYRKDKQNRFIFGNQAFLTDIGQSLAELVGKTDFDFYSAEVAAKHQQDDLEVLQSGMMQETVEEYELPEGQKRYIQVTKSPVHNSRGEVIGLQGISWDITHRRHAELERERLLEAERAQRLRAETLGEIFLALTAQTNYEAVLDEILRQVRRVVSCSAANIMLLHNDVLEIVRWQGYEKFDPDKAIAQLKQPLADFPIDMYVVRSRQPLVIHDVQQDPHWITTATSPWIKSFMATPICLQEQVLGILRLDSNIPYNFSAKDIESLQPLAQAAAIALENARLYDQAQQEIVVRKQTELELIQRNAELLTLLYAGATVSTSLDIQVVLETITREMTSLLGADKCILFQLDETRGKVLTIAEYGLEAHWREELAGSVSHLAGIPLAKRVLVDRFAQQMTVNQPEIKEADLTYMQTHRIKTLLMLPMEFQNHLVGLIQVMDSETERTLSYVEIALAQLLANQAAGALENAKLYNLAQQELAERIKAEEELRRVAARNQAILDTIPDTLLILDHEGRILDYKIKDDSVAAMPVKIGGDEKLNASLLPSNWTRLILYHIDRLRHTGQIQTFECQQVDPNGIKDFEMRLVVSSRAEILAIVRNITGRKEAMRALQESTEALRKSEANLKAIFDNSLQAFVLMDLNFTIQAFNKTSSEVARLIFGSEIEVGRSVRDFIMDSDRDEINRCLSRARDGESVILEKKLDMDGTERWLEYHYDAVFSEKNQVVGICFSTVDIDERKRAADTLAASEARLLAEMQSVLSITRALVSETDLDNLMSFIITQAKQLMKTDGAMVLLLSEDGQYLELAPINSVQSPLPNFQLPLKGALAELAIVAHTVQPGDQDANDDYIVAIRKLLYPAQIQFLWGGPLGIQGQALGVLLLWNKNERKFTDRDSYMAHLFADQAALALYNARLHIENRRLAIEQERQRLARELHDSVTQSLYSIGMAALASLRLLDKTQESKLEDPIKYIHQLSQVALAEMRERVYDLHPTALKERDLVKTLQNHCDMVSEQYGLMIDFSADENLKFSIYQRENLYYIAREALWNVVKHAGPTRVTVRLAQESDKIVLSIADQGPGFALADSQKTEMIGLRSMGERAKLLMGSFEIHTDPKTGTRITVQIPAQSLPAN